MSDGMAIDDTVDVVVIGVGSAGFSASITAAELGARVTLIGHDVIGGTCVNVGCVPSKTLIRATEALHHADRASRFAGIHGNGTLDNWHAVRAQKDALVGEMRQAKYTDLLPAYNNVAYLEGPARIADDGVGLGPFGLLVVRVDQLIAALDAVQLSQDRLSRDRKRLIELPLQFADPNRHPRQFGRVGVDFDAEDGIGSDTLLVRREIERSSLLHYRDVEVLEMR